jgi:hypothetical protein
MTINPSFRGNYLFVPGDELEKCLTQVSHPKTGASPSGTLEAGGTRLRSGARAKVTSREFSWCGPDLIEPDGSCSFCFRVSGYANPEYAGQMRTFAWFSKFLLAQEFFPTFASTVLSRWFNVGMNEVCLTFQMITYRPSHQIDALITPNLIHQDDVGWTSITVLNRTNVLGGHLHIFEVDRSGTPMDADLHGLLYSFLFVDRFDTVIFNDKGVAHYVTPTSGGRDPVASERTVLLIDYMDEFPDYVMSV